MVLNRKFDAFERASLQLNKIGGEDTPVHAIDRNRRKLIQRRPTMKVQRHMTASTVDLTIRRDSARHLAKNATNVTRKIILQSFANLRHPQTLRKLSLRRKKKIHQIAESDEENEEVSSSEGPIYAVKELKQYMVRPQVRRNVNSPWTNIRMQIDNGAATSCLALRDYQSIEDKPVLEKSTAKLTSYSGDRIKPEGQVRLDVQIGDKQVRHVLFQVIEDAPCSLLSGQTSEALQLMTIKKDLLIHSLTDGKELTKEEVLKECKDVFTGLGYIGDYKIELKDGAIPKQDAPRTVPVAIKDELKTKLKDMERKGILEKVTKSTDWVNSAVYVKKPGKLRVCLDPGELNKRTKIPKLPLPTMDNVISKLGKVKVFTVLDAKDGFLQVKLDENSSELTTFHTPFGRYKWLRMPFGICSAPEEFQRHVQNVIEGLNGVETIADDLLVYGIGTTCEEAVIDHDNSLIDLLQRCRERNFKLNPSELRFKQQKVKYNGHIFTADGIPPDPDKVEALTKMLRPRNKAEVRRFLGMINYMAKFLPKLSELSEPLRNLTKEETQFIWSDVQVNAFLKLKKMLTEPPLLRCYDLEEEVIIESDSSDYGMEAVLLQA